MAILEPSEIQYRILEEEFIPFFTHTDLLLCKNVMRGCYEKGMRVFEFTNRHANSFEIFMALKQYRDAELPEMLLGVGTIKDVLQARLFINAGADFLILAVALEEIQEVCKKENVVWIPASAIPSEVFLQENWNLSLVQFLPIKQWEGASSIG
jgi:2-dehydro-3-deoxyphosphogluconate aldolase/(4S)-4-hydroxy-2-oxoglutarate aldolase